MFSNTAYVVQKLTEMLNLLNWKSKYIETDICDGTQWSVEVVRSGRNIRKYGDNKFPDGWDDFCKTVSRLSGKNLDNELRSDMSSWKDVEKKHVIKALQKYDEEGIETDSLA